MNVISYIIYLVITFVITIRVGFVLFTNGRHFLLEMLGGDEKLTSIVNKLLLAGYYLINLGYAALMLNNWKPIDSWTEMISQISFMCGKIIVTLGLMHYFNIITITWYCKKRNTISSL